MSRTEAAHYYNAYWTAYQYNNSNEIPYPPITYKNYGESSPISECVMGRMGNEEQRMWGVPEEKQITTNTNTPNNEYLTPIKKSPRPYPISIESIQAPPFRTKNPHYIFHTPDLAHSLQSSPLLAPLFVTRKLSHEDDRVRVLNPEALINNQGGGDSDPKYKTEMCKNYLNMGKCKFGNKCVFAHGSEELRSKIHLPENFKSKLCHQFHQVGYCQYGEKCQFLHTHISVNRKYGKSYVSVLSKNIKYMEKAIENSSNQKEILKYMNIYPRHRLPVFVRICK